MRRSASYACWPFDGRQAPDRSRARAATTTAPPPGQAQAAGGERGPARARGGNHARRALGRRRPGHAKQAERHTRGRAKPATSHVPVPHEIRGVHVTMALASLRGKLQQYLAMPGLNTVELDVKDENGKVGFVPSAVPLARRTGAAGPYYKAKRAARLAHAKGIYLIGRVVTFEDPVLVGAAARAGDPHERRLALAHERRPRLDEPVRPARLEVQRRPRRGRGEGRLRRDPVRLRALPERRRHLAHPLPRRPPAADVVDDPGLRPVRAERLHPLGARVSVDVFGLAATHDLGIGQIPRRISRYVDAVYPMVYPSHYNPGEYNLPDPNAVPGQTVSHSLLDFQAALEGRKARLTPWLQDFSLGRTYTLDDVQRAGAGGALAARPRLPALERRGPLRRARAAAACMSVMHVCIRPAAALSSAAWR